MSVKKNELEDSSLVGLDAVIWQAVADNSEERSAVIFRHLFYDGFILKMVLDSFHKSETMWPMAFHYSHKRNHPNNTGGQGRKIDHSY